MTVRADAVELPTPTDAALEPGRDLRADLSALLKPRITLMVVLTTAVGYMLATPMVDLWVLAATLVGTGLLSSGSSVFNQVIERRSDALMPRTATRPLPAGRFSVETAVALGLALSLAGTVLLTTAVNHLTALVGLLTLVLYVAAYTPLKRRSSLATIVGAVPGAMPPMMGCTAATGELNMLAWALFGLLFLWQMPHFLAIAWLYRDDYARGGLPMLTVGDSSGSRTWRQMVLYGGALVPVSLLPSVLGYTGIPYMLGALVAGALFLRPALAFGKKPEVGAARRLLIASVLYLPAVLVLMVVDHALFV
ncbi:MAG: heme o synthase [Acidobacteriota bacterium]